MNENSASGGSPRKVWRFRPATGRVIFQAYLKQGPNGNHVVMVIAPKWRVAHHFRTERAHQANTHSTPQKPGAPRG